MPAPAKTSDAEIVAAARAIIAESGIAELTLQRVAAAVGVRAPSLYKRFDDRAALLAAVRETLLAELADVLAAEAGHTPPAAAVSAMGRAYREHAGRLGPLYPLLFASIGPPSPAALAALAPVMAALNALVAPADALAAARTLTAFLHGFVTMEANASFQMPGSIDEAFGFGLAAVIKGVCCAAAPQ